MSRFLSGRLADLVPYVPGEQPQDQPYVKLNTNENPYPPAPGVLAAVDREAVSKLNLYSDPTAGRLEEAIAARHGLSREQVIAGNGSDEILVFCFQAFCDKRTGAAFPDITYGFYKVYAQLFGIDARIVPLDAAFRVIPADYDRMGRTIFLANPNAPTGLCLPLSDVERVVSGNPQSLVVVDEAYVDFGGESAVSLLEKYDNLLVVKTFSKSHNLAGARVGYALSSAPLIDDLRKIKYSTNPYNLNRLSLLAGEAAMRDERYFLNCARKVIETREWTKRMLVSRGFSVTESKANFLFASAGRMDGQTYYERLKARGVLVRFFSGPRTKDWVRITIGTQAQMQALLDATDAVLQEAL